MLVAIAGGHGKIARRLTHLLVAQADVVVFARAPANVAASRPDARAHAY
jgi:nucleoside-diphosphate-sugar epimerase